MRCVVLVIGTDPERENIPFVRHRIFDEYEETGVTSAPGFDRVVLYEDHPLFPLACFRESNAAWGKYQNPRVTDEIVWPWFIRNSHTLVYAPQEK